MHAELYRKILKAFVVVLNAHLRTKTLDYTFHNATKGAYEALFEAAHEIAEKFEDAGYPVTNDADVQALKDLCSSTMDQVLADIKAAIPQCEDPGVDNTLRSQYDELQFQAGSLKGFCSCAKPETPKAKA